MLALRLARGSGPVVLGRRLLLAGAVGGVGFLLLAALAHAAAHPGSGATSAVRLACCAVPLAATAQLAVAVARADPTTRARSGLAAAGLGTARVPVLAATSTAVAGTLGSALALVVFLHLRGDLGGWPLDGAAAGVLAAGHPFPGAAALTLLAVAPTVAAAASAWAVRPRLTVRRSALPTPRGGDREPAADEVPVPAPAGLPWGTALATAGVALSAYASPEATAAPDEAATVGLPGALANVTLGMAGGWLLIVSGIVLAAPGLTHLAGRVLAFGHPGALRLLAGRALQHQAVNVGHPLGALCATAAALLAAVRLEGAGLFGPLGVLGAVVVLACVLGTLAATTAQARVAREATSAVLRRFGAPGGLLRGVVALRAGTLLAVFGVLSWLAAELITLPAVS